MLSEQLVSYNDPPVVETVLVAQFEPLSGLTGGHVGWFWRDVLGESWTVKSETGRIAEQVERFGKNRALRAPRYAVKFQAQPALNRLQITNDSGERMLQIQNDKFIYNWIKKAAGYPRYSVVRESFDSHFEQFRQFVSDNGLGTIRLNQWEVTYVNQIPQGLLWETPGEWANVIPGLLPPVANYGGTLFENMNGEWRSEIPPERGRLHLQIRHQEEPRDNDTPIGVLVVHLTARGPVSDETPLGDGLDLGRTTIVKAFDQITSDKAHEAWGKSE